AFADAWAEGRAMPVEDAMAAALAAEHLGAPDNEPARPARKPLLRVADSGPSPNPVSRGLTRREQEVVALLAGGLTNREIAAELTISERTAESHVCKILSKLSLARRAQLTAWAVQHD